jgi:calcium-dependent protein kinase
LHQIATAIYFMHNFGIAHRDLKPENILMIDKSDDSEIKLVDFGLTKTFGPGETCKEPYGTLCYVAPEILL